MWSRLHRNHVIMPFPSYDTTTNAWAPQADISWCAGPSRESAFVRFPDRFTTEADAVACALRRAESWIDNHLGTGRRGRDSDHTRMTDLIRALKKRPGKARATELLRARGSIQWDAEKTSTFDQFKAVVAKHGVRLNEQTLQKSYAALVKLQRNNHWSSAQTRAKAEQGQQDRSPAQSTARRQRAARPPLGEPEWRGIG